MVADRGKQRGVHQCGADAKQHASRHPHDERLPCARSAGHEPDPDRLNPHPSGDRPLASPSIRQRARGDLRHAPDGGIHTREETDVPDGQPRAREQQQKESPRQTIVEIVHEAGLAARGQAAIAHAGIDEDRHEGTLGPRNTHARTRFALHEHRRIADEKQ